MAASTGRQFTNPPSAKLADPTAEKVRANMALCIRELQKRVNELSDALDDVDVPETTEPEWELVERKTLTSAATSVTFSGLNGNTDVEYKLRGYVVDDSGSNANMALYPNGATTNADGQRLTGTGAAAGGSVATEMLVGLFRPDAEVSYFEGTLWAKAGSVRTYRGTAGNYDVGAPKLYAETIAGCWSDTSTNITSLELSGPSSAFGAGTQISLYRRAS